MIEKLNISYLLIPFGYYNYLLGIVAGGLIILSGNWIIVLTGIIFIAAAYFVLRILFFIPGIFAFPAMHFHHRRSKLLSFIFVLFTILSRTSIIVLWCYFVFLYLFKAEGGTSAAVLMFGYSIINIPMNQLNLRNVRTGTGEEVYETLVLAVMLSVGIFLSFIMNINIFSLIFITGIVITIVRLLLYFSNLHPKIEDPDIKVFSPAPEK